MYFPDICLQPDVLFFHRYLCVAAFRLLHWREGLLFQRVCFSFVTQVSQHMCCGSRQEGKMSFRNQTQIQSLRLRQDQAYFIVVAHSSIQITVGSLIIYLAFLTTRILVLRGSWILQTPARDKFHLSIWCLVMAETSKKYKKALGCCW